MRMQTTRPGKQRAGMTRKDYEALAALRYALRKYFRFSEEAAAKEGISIRQYQALLTIRGFPGRDEVTIGEIAEWLQIHHHSAVGLVDRLVKQKLVVRRKGREDKRQVYIHITNRGEEILEKVASLNKQELKRLQPQRYLARLLSGNQK